METIQFIAKIRKGNDTSHVITVPKDAGLELGDTHQFTVHAIPIKKKDE